MNSASRDVGGDGATTTGPAAEVPNLTLQNYTSADATGLLAWLVAHGVDPYAATPLIRLRQYVHTLLAAGAPPALDPQHPLLHEMSRPATGLKLDSPFLYRQQELFDLVQELTALRRAAGEVISNSIIVIPNSILMSNSNSKYHILHAPTYSSIGALEEGLLSLPVRLAWLPFPSVHRRADRLYEAGAKYLAPGERPFGYAHSLDITGQRATLEWPPGAAEPAFVFRMRVRASMRQTYNLLASAGL